MTLAPRIYLPILFVSHSAGVLLYMSVVILISHSNQCLGVNTCVRLPPPPPRVFTCTRCYRPQVSEVEVNGQIEAVCESVFSEMESQAVDALDLPVPGCFRMRSHSYVRAIEKGCSQEEEEGGVVAGNRRANSPPRSTTTVRTIQSSTGQWERTYLNAHYQLICMCSDDV